MKPKYPEIVVQLEDGNAFSIVAKVREALKKAGVSQKEQLEFQGEAMAGTYDDLLQTVMRWVTVE